MRNNGFVNIIGDVTGNSEKLRNDPSGTNFFLLQEILTTAMREQDKFPENFREEIIHALQAGMRVIEIVSMNSRYKATEDNLF